MSSPQLQPILDRALPGLVVTVAYFRPAPRGMLLHLLADLGLFVHERVSTQPPLRPGQWEQSDVAVIVGDDQPEHLAACRWVSAAITPATLAITPDAQSARLYVAAGAMEAVRDQDSPDELCGALSRVAASARQLREARSDDDVLVFGDVRFRRSQASLRRGERMVRLTAAERHILLALLERPGEPVPHSRLFEVTGGFDYQRLKTTILRLRRKVESLGADPIGLSSVRGFGYVLRH